MTDDKPSIIGDEVSSEITSNSMKKNTKSKKLIKKIFEPDPIFQPLDEVFADIIKSNNRIQKKKKRKPVADWTNTDFMKYFDKNIKNLGFSVEDYSVLGRENFSRAYDILVKSFKNNMSNEILKEYIDWIIFNKVGAVKTQNVSTHILLYDNHINGFLQYHSNITLLEPVKKIKPDTSEVDFEQVFSTGGLDALLASGGIVIASRVMKKNNVPGRFNKISEAISKMPKSAVIALINQTISCAPYPVEDKCDFLSLSKSALDFHNIKDFSKMKYEDYFRGQE